MIRFHRPDSQYPVLLLRANTYTTRSPVIGSEMLETGRGGIIVSIPLDKIGWPGLDKKNILINKGPRVSVFRDNNVGSVDAPAIKRQCKASLSAGAVIDDSSRGPSDRLLSSRVKRSKVISIYNGMGRKLHQRSIFSPATPEESSPKAPSSRTKGGNVNRRRRNASYSWSTSSSSSSERGSRSNSVDSKRSTSPTSPSRNSTSGSEMEDEGTMAWATAKLHEQKWQSPTPDRYVYIL